MVIVSEIKTVDSFDMLKYETTVQSLKLGWIKIICVSMWYMCAVYLHVYICMSVCSCECVHRGGYECPGAHFPPYSLTLGACGLSPTAQPACVWRPSLLHELRFPCLHPSALFNESSLWPTKDILKLIEPSKIYWTSTLCPRHWFRSHVKDMRILTVTGQWLILRRGVGSYLLWMSMPCSSWRCVVCVSWEHEQESIALFGQG